MPVTQCDRRHSVCGAECYNRPMTDLRLLFGLVAAALSFAVFPAHASDPDAAQPTIHVASACEGNRSIAADIFRDSIVVHERAGGNETSHVTRLTGERLKSADSLFILLRGLGGALVLRCPNVESVSCRFEARLSLNRLECTNCSACSDDLDRMSLSTLHRFKSLLRELNLFL
jgi:hypothetical protein